MKNFLFITVLFFSSCLIDKTTIYLVDSNKEKYFILCDSNPFKIDMYSKIYQNSKGIDESLSINLSFYNSKNITIKNGKCVITILDKKQIISEGELFYGKYPAFELMDTLCITDTLKNIRLTEDENSYTIIYKTNQKEIAESCIFIVDLYMDLIVDNKQKKVLFCDTLHKHKFHSIEYMH